MKQEERERGRERGREGGIVLHVHVHMAKQNICGATLLYTVILPIAELVVTLL